MNCIKIIVINPDLNWEILSMAAQSVMAGYTVPEIPVLIYPGDYLQSHNGSEGKNISSGFSIFGSMMPITWNTWRGASG